MFHSSVVHTTGLTKFYGRRVGVDRLDLAVPEGGIYGFVGPNGSGKTTAIRILMGFLRPTAGVARVFGLDCRREGVRIRREVGYLPGDLRLYPWLTCRGGLELFGRIRGKDLSQSGAELAEAFGLEPDLRVERMSRGTRQKLGLVLALAHQPRLLILDEPTTALDPIVQERLYQHLRGLAAAGHTVFFSSHTLGEVERLCDRLAILREGRLVADTTMAALRARVERKVTIVWHDEAAARQTPPFEDLAGLQRRGFSWEAALTGSAAELVRWCASRPIADVTISEPDLSELFRQFYEEGSE